MSLQVKTSLQDLAERLDDAAHRHLAGRIGPSRHKLTAVFRLGRPRQLSGLRQVWDDIRTMDAAVGSGALSSDHALRRIG